MRPQYGSGTFPRRQIFASRRVRQRVPHLQTACADAHKTGQSTKQKRRPKGRRFCVSEVADYAFLALRRRRVAAPTRPAPNNDTVMGSGISTPLAKLEPQTPKSEPQG